MSFKNIPTKSWVNDKLNADNAEIPPSPLTIELSVIVLVVLIAGGGILVLLMLGYTMIKIGKYV